MNTIITTVKNAFAAIGMALLGVVALVLVIAVGILLYFFFTVVAYALVGLMILATIILVIRDTFRKGN